jgi:hypothetical protein
MLRRGFAPSKEYGRNVIDWSEDVRLMAHPFAGYRALAAAPGDRPLRAAGMRALFLLSELIRALERDPYRFREQDYGYRGSGMADRLTRVLAWIGVLGLILARRRA